MWFIFQREESEEIEAERPDDIVDDEDEYEDVAEDYVNDQNKKNYRSNYKRDKLLVESPNDSHTEKSEIKSPMEVNSI